MAFDIKIQRNESPNNSLDKNITDIVTLEGGTLRDATSIIDPVIIVESTMANVRNANYLTIDMFGRSYFIKNITSVRNGLIEIACHCDVLSSFKDQIRANNAVIRRNQNANNIRVNDGVFTVRQDPHIVYRAFGGTGFITQELVLAVAGS